MCWTFGTHDFPRMASRWKKHFNGEFFDQEAFNLMLAILLVSFLRGKDTKNPILFIVNLSNKTTYENLKVYPPHKGLKLDFKTVPRCFDECIELTPYEVYIARLL